MDIRIFYFRRPMEVAWSAAIDIDLPAAIPMAGNPLKHLFMRNSS